VSRAGQWVLLLAVTALAGLFRLHRLDAIPPGLFGDEAADALPAVAIERGEALPVYIEEPIKWTSREPMYHYMMAAVFALFGPTVTTLRLTSALIGIATVALFFWLCRAYFGAHFALFAAALLACCRWHVTASRIGLRAVLVPLWIVLTLLALTAVRRTQGWRAALALGAVIGAGLYTYPAYWIVPPALALLVAVGVAGRGRAQVIQALRLGGVVALAALVTAAPLILYAIDKPDYFFARAERTAMAEGQASEPFSLSDNLQRVLFMLHLRGDENPRHNIPGRPLLDPLMGIFFAVGLWHLARSRPSDRNHVLVSTALLAFWLLPLLPSALTDSAPHALRVLGAVPAVCVIAACGLDRLAGWFPSRGRAPAAKQVVALAALAAIALLNYRDYFHEWGPSRVVENAFNTDTSRFFDHLATLARRGDLYLSSYLYDAPQVRFLNLQRHLPLRHLDEAALISAGRGRARILVSDSPGLNALITELYPQAQVIGRYAVYGSSSGRIFYLQHRFLRPNLPPGYPAAIHHLIAGERAQEKS
jgi:4-amino-4-deoxy-L-arabinose transferase-like glycosyltransferase